MKLTLLKTPPATQADRARMPGEEQTLSAQNLGPKAFSVKLSSAAFLDINVGIFAVFFPIEIFRENILASGLPQGYKITTIFLDVAGHAQLIKPKA